MSIDVTLGELAIDVAQIDQLDIDLDNEGGPRAATMSVTCLLEQEPRIGYETLVVTYKGADLFRGRLESLSARVDNATGYTMTFAGPLVVLRDHRAFRGIYVDSDQDNWRDDQGGMSDRNSIFTTAIDEGGMSILVIEHTTGD